MLASAENDPRKAGTIWVMDLDDPPPQILPLVPAAFRLAGLDDLPALTAAMGEDSQDEICRRIESGRRCYTTWVEGQLAAYGWVSFDEEYVGEVRLLLRLLPGEVYIWDCATLPAYRQRHLYSALLAFIAGELHCEGLCRAWIGTEQENIPSQRGIARAGFRHVANLVVDRVFALRMVWVQGQEGAAEDLVAEARRVFLDNRDQSWLAAIRTPARNLRAPGR